MGAAGAVLSVEQRAGMADRSGIFVIRIAVHFSRQCSCIVSGGPRGWNNLRYVLIRQEGHSRFPHTHRYRTLIRKARPIDTLPGTLRPRLIYGRSAYPLISQGSKYTNIYILARLDSSAEAPRLISACISTPSFQEGS